MPDNRREVVPRLQATLPPDLRTWFSARQSEGVPWLEAHVPVPFRLGFSTRWGGVSGEDYAELNLSYWVGDDPVHVDQNLRVLGGSLGFPAEHVVLPRQVHGLEILETDECRRRGGHPPCDGLIVRTERDRRHLVLMISGDCLTVVLVGKQTLALIHAGWRGLRDGILQKGVAAMGEDRPSLAVFGPAIGPCCYEVGADVAEEMGRRLGTEMVVESGGRLHLDLWAGAEAALGEAGLERGAVVNPRLCTLCHPDLFYSHRGEGPRTGRHTAFAWVEGHEAQGVAGQER